MTLGNDNGTDGQTDRQTDRRTDRVRRNMRPPPKEEGRIISEWENVDLYSAVSLTTANALYVALHKRFEVTATEKLWSTSLTTTENTKLRCRWQTSPGICAKTTAWLNSWKHDPPHMCYHAEFGPSAFKDAGINTVPLNTGEPSVISVMVFSFSFSYSSDLSVTVSVTVMCFFIFFQFQLQLQLWFFSYSYCFSASISISVSYFA